MTNDKHLQELIAEETRKAQKRFRRRATWGIVGAISCIITTLVTFLGQSYHKHNHDLRTKQIKENLILIEEYMEDCDDYSFDRIRRTYQETESLATSPEQFRKIFRTLRDFRNGVEEFRYSADKSYVARQLEKRTLEGMLKVSSGEDRAFALINLTMNFVKRSEREDIREEYLTEEKQKAREIALQAVLAAPETVPSIILMSPKQRYWHKLKKRVGATSKYDGPGYYMRKSYLLVKLIEDHHIHFDFKNDTEVMKQFWPLALKYFHGLNLPDMKYLGTCYADKLKEMGKTDEAQDVLVSLIPFYEKHTKDPDTLADLYLEIGRMLPKNKAKRLYQETKKFLPRAGKYYKNAFKTRLSKLK